MKIIYHTPIWQAPWENCILTLGTFDGLHKGHLKLIKKAISIGHSEKLPIVLLTYSPSPKSLLFPENYEQIYTQYEKQEMLKTLSINYVVVFSISKQTLEISAQYYLKNVIMKSLRPKHIVIGRNHTFGRNRRGNARYLTKAQKKYNFLLHIVNHKRLLGKSRSSSYLRNLLKQGELSKFHLFSKIPFFIEGKVVKGDSEGRKIGFPTANLLMPDDKIRLKNGVYIAYTLFNNRLLKSLVNIGTRPTFEGEVNIITTEVYIHNFSGDLYDQTIRVYLFKRLRDEKKFNSKEELKDAIHKDLKNIQTKPDFLSLKKVYIGKYLL